MKETRDGSSEKRLSIGRRWQKMATCIAEIDQAIQLLPRRPEPPPAHSEGSTLDKLRRMSELGEPHPILTKIATVRREIAELGAELERFCGDDYEKPVTLPST